MLDRTPSHGRFITFEGGEGVGKSTQVKRLVAALSQQSIPAVRTREPGDPTLTLSTTSAYSQRWLAATRRVCDPRRCTTTLGITLNASDARTGRIAAIISGVTKCPLPAASRS